MIIFILTPFYTLLIKIYESSTAFNVTLIDVNKGIAR